MKTSTIILPVLDNNLKPLHKLHDWLEIEICKTFGGCTVTEGTGLWINPNGKLYKEKVKQYDIGMADLNDGMAKLRLIARELAEKAKQECIFVRDGNNSIEFIDANYMESEAA